MAARYRVTLTRDEIDTLEEITHSGVRAARTVLYARALLLLDQGKYGNAKWNVDAAATAVGLTDRTLEHLKERLVKYGLDAALERKKPVKPSRRLVFDGVFAARLTQLACSEAPKGYSRWTIRLLADKLVELQIVPKVSAMTICNTLKKMNFSLTAAGTGKSRQMRIRTS
jgi:hypothetical protein